MELMATSIDGFLAYWCGLHDVRGEIHSVFQRALNIRTSGGQLISILSGADAGGPNTVVTVLPEGMDFISMGLRSGMPVRLAGRDVQFGDGALHLRMSRAQKWWPRLAGGVEPVDLVRLRVNLEAVTKGLAGERMPDGLGCLLPHVGDLAAGRWKGVRRSSRDELTVRALPAVAKLIQGFLRRDRDSLKKGAEGLLGLGKGLTPSGDDVLLGFVGTLSVVSKRVGGPEVDSILECMRDHVSEIRHRTTFISSNLLAYACAGRIGAPILDVIRALFFENAISAQDRARALLTQGESSGSEVLFGILLALSLLPRLEGS